MDGATISKMLEDRVKQVCQHLLPNGKQMHGEWATVALGYVEEDLGKCVPEDL